MVASLSTTWGSDLRRGAALVPRPVPPLPGPAGASATPQIARELIEKRFAARFAAVDFTPPYPTWPIRERSSRKPTDYTPRRLLVAIDRHIRACLIDDEVRELSHLSDVPTEDQDTKAPVRTAPAISDDELARIEARFEEFKRNADVTSPLEHDTEDATFPALLAAGLQAWIVERGDGGEKFSIDPPPSSKPDLHARLRRELDERSEEEREQSADQSRTEDQMHWSFRAISDTHHGVAALHRIRRARPPPA